MKRSGLFSAFLAVVMAGTFLAGLFEPELRAQGGLPEHFFSLRPSGRDLDPLTTYNRSLSLLRERYYGDLPSDRRLTYAAIRGLLNTLDDPYTRFLDPDEYRSLREENQGEFEGIGAQLDVMPTREGYIRILRPLPNGPAARAGVQKGDLITRVDGKSVVGMTVDQAVKIIRGRADTQVRLSIQRAGQVKEFTITRRPVEFEVVEGGMKEPGIGYVFLAQFNEMADQKLAQRIREMEREGMRGLVLDLRGNPGGLLESAVDVSSRFVLPRSPVVWIVEAGGERDLRKSDLNKYLGGKWPLVVLVNRTSASASEIVAGAVRDNKAGTIVGTTTFGKGLVQTVVPLEDSSACMITTAKYLTPSGRDINRTRDQRGGVEPDHVVEITEEQWQRNEDPQLRKAIELLREKVRPSVAQSASGR